MNTKFRVENQVVTINAILGVEQKEGINPKTGDDYLPFLRIELKNERGTCFKHILWLDDDGTESIDMYNLRTYTTHFDDIEDVVKAIQQARTEILLAGRFIKSSKQLHGWIASRE